jgi:hypothetical protein
MLCTLQSIGLDIQEWFHTPNIAMGYRFASLPQCTVTDSAENKCPGANQARPLIGRLKWFLILLPGTLGDDFHY